MKGVVEKTADASFQADRWIEAFREVAGYYRLPVSSENARRIAQWERGETEDRQIRTIARSIGFFVHFAAPEGFRLSSGKLPAIAQLANGELAIISAIGSAGQASVSITGEGGLRNSIPVEELMRDAVRFVLPRPSRTVPDARVDAYIRPYREHWLRLLLLKDARSYGPIVIASLIANALALASVLFSMQVYDRVIPAQSFPTLYVLFIGVLLAIGLNFMLRWLRMNIIDVLGKRADMRMSDQVFGHALRVQTRERPSSTGTFIAQLRDLEQLREMLTSTTVSAIVDLPFFLLFLLILLFIAGPLALVPLGALALLIVPALLVQRRLRAYTSEAMREASLRNAMLVEAVQGIEDIKALQAEERFQQHWNHLNSVTGDAQLRLRGLTNSISAWSQSVQTGVYAAIVFFGAPLVMAGEMTTGALVAASILGSRMMAPIAQVTQVLARLQQAKVSAASADRIMALPVDNPDDEHRIEVPSIAGDFAVHSAVFKYGDSNSPPGLAIKELHIRPGEKIAVLGRNGAGKSTLLQGLSGLLRPDSGEVLLDNFALHQIDPGDVRRDVGLLTQNSRLFHGTIRQNLTLGAPRASNSDIAAALEMVGADEFIRRSRAGLEHVVQEGGGGLSGGQIQALLLARLLIREPRILLLDEPTASMDETTERLFTEKFKVWSKSRTVILATHRMRLLDLVDRIIVIHNGAITLDAGKQEALSIMQGKSKAA
ncbi:type I secretion system permease/ATPase [Tsuneonella sp. CC-YZS046]|uniref:type I secretion system permease/ATPase n=1 Tax=Tsuneonella sp. CC-YZS046 TaxID=3042152 RepID=UPI002D792B0E|nr:type I secretion system permease/ATPase [Tsuneonella sp. CC-YZS046]WRO65547.1 type I secretion system permease/ATPase [Tsuneonella sp. CC-YZS046]